jgi:AcrR family transcriptional regulator
MSPARPLAKRALPTGHAATSRDAREVGAGVGAQGRDGPMSGVRDRDATEERIVAAVGSVLARDGFGAIGINSIAREAGVDKVLIYRYFGGLPELLRRFGASGRFWPGVDEILGDDAAAVRKLPVTERLALFFDRFVDALRARPLTIEILAAEIVQRNELTAILETEREQWGDCVARVIGGDDWSSRPHVQGATLLWVAGIQYLLVRARTIRSFGGIDLRSDAGWQALKASLRTSAPLLFAATPPLSRARRSPRSRPARRSA